jgi:hypothetical protein
MGEIRHAYRNLVGKPTGKDTISRPTRSGIALKWISVI